ncbi:hypothetical protein Nepgr_007782, partial [Nepenthes gracilis]
RLRFGYAGLGPWVVTAFGVFDFYSALKVDPAVHAAIAIVGIGTSAKEVCCGSGNMSLNSWDLHLPPDRCGNLILLLLCLVQHSAWLMSRC